MAEFCLKCFNELEGTDYDESEVVLDKYLDLCEGCGQMCRCVADIRRRSWFPFPFPWWLDD